MHTWELPPQRPPSEAHSLLIRATRNCPWGRCEFCGSYRGQKFSLRPVAEVARDIAAARAAAEGMIAWAERIDCRDRLAAVARANGMPWLASGEVRHVALGDADSPIMKTADLIAMLTNLRKAFPALERVTSYARAKTLLHKQPEELRALRDAGLVRLHVGIESGDDTILAAMHKGAAAEEMIRAGEKACAAGFELSLYVMPGLGGRARWEEHARATADVLNRINPRFIRLRTLDLAMVQSAPLYEKWQRGEFSLQRLDSLVAEVRTLVEELRVTSDLVAGDFAWNYYLLDIDGKLPEDRDRILQTLDRARTMAEEKEAERARLRAERCPS